MEVRAEAEADADVDTDILHPQTANYGADECLTAARAALKAGEEVLTEKSVVLHLALRGYFGMTMILLLAYHPDRGPGQVAGAAGTGLGHHDLMAHDDRMLILQAHRVLSQWKVVPFVNPPLAKLEEIMAAKDIA